METYVPPRNKEESSLSPYRAECYERYLAARDWIDRQCLHTLKEGELKLLLLLLSNTLGRGWRDGNYTKNQLINGISDQGDPDGGMYFRGTGLSRNGLTDARNSLVSRGVLLVIESNAPPFFSADYILFPKWEPESPKTKEDTRGGRSVAREKVVQLLHQGRPGSGQVQYPI